MAREVDLGGAGGLHRAADVDPHVEVAGAVAASGTGDRDVAGRGGDRAEHPRAGTRPPPRARAAGAARPPPNAVMPIVPVPVARLVTLLLPSTSTPHPL